MLKAFHSTGGCSTTHMLPAELLQEMMFSCLGPSPSGIICRGAGGAILAWGWWPSRTGAPSLLLIKLLCDHRMNFSVHCWNCLGDIRKIKIVGLVWVDTRQNRDCFLVVWHHSHQCKGMDCVQQLLQLWWWSASPSKMKLFCAKKHCPSVFWRSLSSFQRRGLGQGEAMVGRCYRCELRSVSSSPKLQQEFCNNIREFIQISQMSCLL